VNEAIERLCKLLYHEKCSPAILPYQKDLIEGTYADGKMTSLGLLELVQQQVPFAPIFRMKASRE
jgi:hypothetical protein